MSVARILTDLRCNNGETVAFVRATGTAEGYDARAIARAAIKRWPERSDRAIAVMAGCDHKTVGSVRGEMLAGGEIPHHDTRIGRDGVAKRCGVSGWMVRVVSGGRKSDTSGG